MSARSKIPFQLRAANDGEERFRVPRLAAGFQKCSQVSAFLVSWGLNLLYANMRSAH
jgi:hypothetical protein